MKAKQIVKIISIPAKIVTYLILLLVAVALLQGITLGLAEEYYRKYSIKLSKQNKGASKPELSEAEKKQRAMDDATREVLPDGTIHLVQKEKGPSKRVKTIYSVDGDILWKRESDEKPPYTYIEWPEGQRNFDYQDSLTAQRMTQTYAFSPDFSRSVVVPVVSGDKDKSNILERWRYEPITDVFTGFDKDGYRIGFMGSNGFAESKAEAKPFGRFDNMTGWSSTPFDSPFLLWQTREKLYQINFVNRKVEMLFDAAGDKIRYIAFQNWHVPKKYDKSYRPTIYVSKKYYELYRPTIYVSTKSKKHYILTKNPRQKMELKLPEEFDKSEIAICAYQDDIFIKHYGIKGMPSSFDRKEREEWSQSHDKRDRVAFVNTYKIDQDATPVLIDSIEKQSSSHRLNKALQAWQDRKLFMKRIQKYQTSVSPILSEPAWVWALDRRWQDPKGRSEMRSFLYGLLEFLNPVNVVLNCIVSVVMVVLAGLHGWSRRRGWGEFIFWLVFVAAFNLAGLLTYISLKHTVVITCSGCGRRRGLEREDCPACGLDLPEPARREVDLIGVS